MYYKKCAVACCKNNSNNQPKKIFMTMPAEPYRRRKWFQLLNLDLRRMSNNNIFCCEDHFDLPEDAENWMFYKMAGSYIRLKKHVVPHKNLEEACESTQSQLTDSDRKRKSELLEKVVVPPTEIKLVRLWIDEHEAEESDANVSPTTPISKVEQSLTSDTVGAGVDGPEQDSSSRPGHVSPNNPDSGPVILIVSPVVIIEKTKTRKPSEAQNPSSQFFSCYNGTETYHCENCNFMTPLKTHMAHHNKTVHSQMKTFEICDPPATPLSKCSKCDFWTFSEFLRLRHAHSRNGGR